jgi:hypothetical protein
MMDLLHSKKNKMEGDISKPANKEKEKEKV